MCLVIRGDADMSRISNRASTVAAILSIVLLVIFLVILWTGVHTATRGNDAANGSLHSAFETLEGFLGERSNESTTMHVTVDEGSFTNEGESA